MFLPHFKHKCPVTGLPRHHLSVLVKIPRQSGHFSAAALMAVTLNILGSGGRGPRLMVSVLSSCQGFLDGSAYCQPSARRYLLVMGLCPNTLTSHHSSSHHFKILKGNDARHKSKSLKSKHIHIIGDLLLSCNSKTVDLS